MINQINVIATLMGLMPILASAQSMTDCETTQGCIEALIEVVGQSEERIDELEMALEKYRSEAATASAHSQSLSAKLNNGEYMNSNWACTTDRTFQCTAECDQGKFMVAFEIQKTGQTCDEDGREKDLRKPGFKTTCCSFVPIE